jgi:hypothetical protein
VEHIAGSDRSVMPRSVGYWHQSDRSNMPGTGRPKGPSSLGRRERKTPGTGYPDNPFRSPEIAKGRWPVGDRDQAVSLGGGDPGQSPVERATRIRRDLSNNNRKHGERIAPNPVWLEPRGSAPGRSIGIGTLRPVHPDTRFDRDRRLCAVRVNCPRALESRGVGWHSATL